MDRLGSFSRVIWYDKRGTGVSDPVPLASLPTIEQWTDDARTVMDAVGVEQAVIFGDTEGGPMAAMLAASHPGACALVLVGLRPLAARRRRTTPSACPKRRPRSSSQAGNSTGGHERDPRPDRTAVANDPEAGWLRYSRLAMPRRAGDHVPLGHGDRHPVGLPSIRVPTLVVHRAGNRHHRVAFGRYLADHIPDAKYVELPGADLVSLPRATSLPCWTRSRSS